MSSEKSKVARAAGVVGAATFLSRILGYIRDMVMASFFGAGLYSDAFIAAFRIPNLLRRLFGEGSLSIAFVPVFTEYLTNQGEKEAFQMAGSAIKLLAAILTITAICGIILSPLIVRVIAPGFLDSTDKFEITVILTRIMFPYIIFIGLVALAMGILNVLGHFAAPALAPVFLNLAMIGSIYGVALVSDSQRNRVLGLAFGVLLGGALQLGLQLPFLRKKGFKIWHKSKIWHKGLARIGRLMLPAIFGAAVYQINVLVGTLLASLLPEGSVSYLYYADRLVQFPLGIFAIATATAVLPTLSRQAAAKDYDELKLSFGYAMRLVLFITLPSMVGLIILRVPIVALLFKRGAFDAETVRLTAIALFYYGIGLWAFATVRIVVATFYALQDTKTPVKTATISIIINIIFGLLLMKPLGHGGLALATSLASAVNLVLLVIMLRKKLGALGWRDLVIFAIKAAICSLCMGAVVYGLALYFLQGMIIGITKLLFGLFICILAGIISYGIFAYFFRLQELNSILELAGKGFNRK